MATKKKQRKTEGKNHEFKVEWTKSFTFIQNSNGLSTCLICQKKLGHNFSCLKRNQNFERHYTTKHMSLGTSEESSKMKFCT